MDNRLNKRCEADALIWSEQQIALPRAGQFDQLDPESVIAVLEYQVQSDKEEVARRLRSLITSLLKYQFQPQRRSRSWVMTINSHRNKIQHLLQRMPSLRSQLDEYVADEYPRAIRDAAWETCLPPSTFPQKSPYTTDQILDANFFPDQNEKAVDP
ncbi:protein of unknown function DUF29 [Duganella sp. CF402]|uniref:DUF29 domain-containing protein n=1 Tax=unclassified Duganella TaxID=2636909 RepID=UPI0008ADD79A|nr:MULTISPECIES: DUF29 domain-containing protein [unclassified Duganella]RZT08946.1 uncharacterized protein DUF29 [Duganella sp. BK701]SEL76008.1 protein of unknown function DUF29 [Duganella sp. CF402]